MGTVPVVTAAYVDAETDECMLIMVTKVCSKVDVDVEADKLKLK
jgi:hypothetical protein